ncbi:MAG: CDP-paratose 2-epimerase [Solirubrobacteraceae bacterium]|jgi:CDP-paratose 2-epimerase|nr:CDP-paratose 2-epimerase [Solirubrobacteraceae bacterium]MEA2137337.1 CDP-paratose 2-epimerase [Solirubrobacteraceae bacterium]
MSERTLITGGAGFVGTNLADRIASEGGRVIVFDNLSRAGVERNLRWLTQRHGSAIDVEIAELRDERRLARALAASDRAFHLAAQVAVTTSLDEPVRDATVNLNGTINLLEAARACQTPPALLFSSTNKVYGGLDDIALGERATRYEPLDADVLGRGIGESRPLQFSTPYGCSKGAADQYVLDYAHSYGLPTAVFRMSCIYGPHQCGNEDQGWVAHFVISALERRPITIFGDGKQVRDVLYVDDLVDAFLRAHRDIGGLAGRAFNIGGGVRNAISLVELVDLLEERLGERPLVQFGPWRRGDQRYYVSDTAAFAEATGWRPRVDPRAGVARLHDWLAAHPRIAAAA